VKRRHAIKGLLGLGGLGMCSSIYAWQIEPFWLEFVKQEMPVPHLPAHLEGATLMQISDMHVGNAFDWHFIVESFKQAQKFHPDFVVYTGDYVSYDGPQQFDQLEMVLRHVVRGKMGTVGILGNHDYGKDATNNKVAAVITEMMHASGLHILRNDAKELEGLNFIGFDDYWATNFHPERAISNYDQTRANIVLCHNPDVCDLDVWHGYKGWILSGHTHGGQCRLPLLDPPILPVENKNYTAGKFQLGDGRHLYINRALGHSLQMRFNVRPEITLFTLLKA